MDKLDIRHVDLNLLLAFDALLEHRSVTRAGEAIGLSQPAMSAALSRLRATFDDALFVKLGPQMQPTIRAELLADPVRRVVQAIRTEILLPSGFDPLHSDRVFTLITPDIGEMLFVPPLIAHFSTVAPGVRIHAISRPRGTAASALEEGAADLALGYFPDLKGAGFFQQKLFENRHVCVMRQHHPLASRATLDLDTYLAQKHVVVRPDGREHVFEQHLHRQGIQRDTVTELSHFMSVLPAIESSDLVATVPADLAQLFRRYAQVCLHTAPLDVAAIAVHQFWHRRAHQDPAVTWLRAQVLQLLGRGNKTALSASPAA